MRKVLIVDDSRVVRKLAKRIFTGMDFRAAEAEDGAAALQQCSTAMPDLVLLDWNMPNMDGMDFLRRLRQLPGGAEPKVMFCTAKNSMASIEEAINAGADEYVMKPFDEEIIRTKLLNIGLA